MGSFYKTRRGFLKDSAGAGIMMLVAGGYAKSADGPVVDVAENKDKISVRINGRLFTEYNYKDVPRPFFYPVIGPTGKVVTRNWPMKKGVKGESHDHPHHRSWWFAHMPVNGHNFWHDGGRGKIVHNEFLGVKSGRRGLIACTNKWVAANGEVVCTDTREHEFYPVEKGIFAEFKISIHASQGKVVMGDSKEGTMAIRVAPQLRLQGKLARGHIINSEGVRGKKAWGKSAAWCDYWGPLGDEVTGIAIFDHPDNLRHPTWWHARHYGLFAANPFGAHYFQGKPKGTGDYTINAGDSLTLRYGFYFHVGTPKQAEVDRHFRNYAKTDGAETKK